jgi:hypothetical protein
MHPRRPYCPERLAYGTINDCAEDQICRVNLKLKAPTYRRVRFVGFILRCLVEATSAQGNQHTKNLGGGCAHASTEEEGKVLEVEIGIRFSADHWISVRPGPCFNPD